LVAVGKREVVRVGTNTELRTTVAWLVTPGKLSKNKEEQQEGNVAERSEGHGKIVNGGCHCEIQPGVQTLGYHRQPF
jgi:hypothetical protein